MKILEKILYYGLIFSLFTPLIISDSLIFPFVSTKAYFFYILVDILFIAYLILLSKDRVYPKRSKLLLSFIALTIFGFILDLFGVSFKNSFWGNYERMVGIYTSIHLLIYLWLLVSVFNCERKYYKLLNISLIVNFLLSIYGVLQYFKVDFFGMVAPADDRIIATFGNAAFLAGFVLFFIFLALFLFFKTKNKYWKIFYLISIVADVIIIFMTATRGALVGLVFSVLIMLVLFLLFYENKRIKIASSILSLIIILSVGSVFFLKDSEFIKNNLALRRISQINLQETTTASRLVLWRMSIEAVKDRPIAGYGQNNIRIPLDKYHDSSLIESWFDSSHSKFFDELLAHGLMGFFVQIGFFIFMFWVIFRDRKRDFIGSIILMGLLLAYFIQALFIFDSFMLNVIFVLFLGLIIVRDDNYDSGLLVNKNLTIYISISFIVVLIFFWVWSYNTNISGAKNMALAFDVGSSDISKMMDIYKKTEEGLFTNYDILAPTMAKTAMDIFEDSDKYTDVQLKNYIDLMTKVYNKAIEDSGGYSKFYVNLAKLYQLASKHPRLDYLNESILLLEKALEISPNRIDIYYALAQGYFFQNNEEKAEATLANALNVNNGEQSDSRLAQTHYNLAQIQAHKGSVNYALYNINQTYQLDAGKNIINFNKLEEFAKIFIDREEWSATTEVFLLMHEIEPDNLDIYYNLALSYAKNGERDKAIEWANKILELDSSKSAEVNQFLDNL